MGFAVLAAGAIAAFSFAVLGNVYAVGICCADDALFAHVSKNLAFGRGYVSSVRVDEPWRSSEAFYPGIGTGPTVILPAAVLIHGFGNRYWVPGLTMFGILSGLFAALIWTLRRQSGDVEVAAFIVAFLSAAYCLTVFQFQWYPLLGEMPAALLVTVSILCWAADPRDRRRLVTSSILLSLAILAKMLAFLAVVVWLAAICLWRSAEPRSRSERAADLAIALAAFAVLPLLFECWKLLVLGIDGYPSILAGTGRLIEQLAVDSPSDVGWPLLIRRRSQAFYDRYGSSLFEVIALSVLACWIAARSKSGMLRRASLVIGAVIGTYTVWWLFWSIGRERYMLMAVVLFAALLSFPLLTLGGRQRAAYVGMLVLWSMPNWGRLSYPVKDASFLSRSERLEHLLAVTRFLEARSDGRPIATQAWQTGIDIEYMLSDIGRIRHYSTIAPDEAARGYWIVVNSLFEGRTDSAFERVVAACGEPRLNLPPYVVWQCRTPQEKQ
jgi:hypothetical protein